VHCSVLAVKPEGFVSPVKLQHSRLRAAESKAPAIEWSLDKAHGTEKGS
jgi:hypothetical protein